VEPELVRKNLRLGFLLFVIVGLIFGGAIVVAEIYNAVNG
jgi:hypothetical protein